MKPGMSYPSPAEIKIYMQDIWVDDIYRLEYSLTNARTPLYDYTSQFFKAVAEGNAIIQGQLIINFRFPGYLEYAIDTRLMTDPNILLPLDKAGKAYQDLLVGTDQQRVQKLLAYKAAGSLNYAKTLLKEVGENTNENASPNRSLTHKTKPFNIKIKYGGEEAAHVKIIKDCYIIGEGQTISAAAIAGGDAGSSGMPIYEQYSFFAKEIIDELTERGEKLTSKGTASRNYRNLSTATGLVTI